MRVILFQSLRVDQNRFRGTTAVSYCYVISAKCLPVYKTAGLCFKWSEAKNIIAECQAGFRHGRSTDNQIFILEQLWINTCFAKKDPFIACLSISQKLLTR